MNLRNYILASAVSLTRLAAGAESEVAPHAPIIEPTNNPSIQSTNTLSLDSVLGEVLQNNPSLKAARANWEAMKQRVPQARAWEDARAGFDTVAGRFVSIPPNSFTDQKLMVEQAVPLSGKNRLLGKASEAEAAAALGELHRRELDVAARARTLYYRLANAYEQRNINDENTQLLERFVEISRTKYEAGSKPESDVLIAETDLAKLHEERADILRQLSDAESQLNVVMNRPAQSDLPRPDPMLLFTLDLELSRLQNLALSNRPEILTAAKKIDAAEAKLAAAKREWVPDPSLRVEASRYNDASQPASELMAGVSINLPWFNRHKYQAAIEEAKQMKLAAEFDLESARKESLGLVRDALQKVETYHHHVELFRDRILPLARQNINATRLAYETDKTGFLNLIDSERTLREVQRMYWNHLTDYLTGLAELEAVTGAQLSQTQRK